jgi:hypothetical protein
MMDFNLSKMEQSNAAVLDFPAANRISNRSGS